MNSPSIPVTTSIQKAAAIEETDASFHIRYLLVDCSQLLIFDRKFQLLLYFCLIGWLSLINLSIINCVIFLFFRSQPLKVPPRQLQAI